MREQSKAAKRRFNDGAFHTRYFVGHGIDVGCGPDPLSQYTKMFRGIESLRDWDQAHGDGDAQFLEGFPDQTFEFLVSSHCLEHLTDPGTAFVNWIRVVKLGGFLIITVPDEQLYERGQWPSRYSGEHLWSFTLKKNSTMPRSINLIDLAFSQTNVEIERVMVIHDFFDEFDSRDQTLLPNPECAIELVLRKAK